MEKFMAVLSQHNQNGDIVGSQRAANVVFVKLDRIVPIGNP
jgi:hypothetical protein